MEKYVKTRLRTIWFLGINAAVETEVDQESRLTPHVIEPFREMLDTVILHAHDGCRDVCPVVVSRPCG